MRTIRVTGKGTSRIHPDRTQLYLQLEGIYKEYGITMERSAADSETLISICLTHGFSRQEVKTVSFDINPEYEGYQEDNVYKQRLSGYRYHHSLKVTFDSDNERLSGILRDVAASALNPEIQIGYTASDPEAVKNELLAKAVADSQAKAEILASAAGLAVGQIQSIDYSWGQVDLEVRPMRALAVEDSRSFQAKANTYALDIEPDDIEVSDTVTILWEIL